MDEKITRFRWTEEVTDRCENYFGPKTFSDPENMELNHHIMQARKAHNIMKRDVIMS